MKKTYSVEEKKFLKSEALSRFKGGMTPFLSKKVHESEAIKKQFVPSWEEGISFGRDAPFEEGKNNHGLYGLERIYRDRVIITPYFDCAAYCRYCFRKTRTIAGDGRTMTENELKKVCDFIASDPRIKTALITGGDPFTQPDILFDTISSLAKISSLRNIRVGTRHILFKPQSFSFNLCDQLGKLRTALKPKTFSIYLSLNHVDELTSEVREAVKLLRSQGFILRGQTVLMKGINDTFQDILALMEEMFSEEILPYYLFHCMDVTGTAHLRTSVQKGLDIMDKMASLSGALSPHYVYVTPVGKHRLIPGVDLQYENIEGLRYIRSHGPYMAADYKDFSGKKSLPLFHEEAIDGRIISRYLDGDNV